MNSLPKYYVYEWVRPDYGVVFWVGKGHGKRAYTFKRNKHTNHIIATLAGKGMKPRVRILARFVNENSALDFEIERIAFWEPLGELTNYTKGGQGTSGYRHSPEECARRSKFNPMKRPEIIAPRSGDNHHYRRPGLVSVFATDNNPCYSEESIARMSGPNNPMKNPEIALENAEKRKGVSRSKEQRENIRKGQLEHQSKISPSDRKESNRKAAETRKVNRELKLLTMSEAEREAERKANSEAGKKAAETRRKNKLLREQGLIK